MGVILSTEALSKIASQLRREGKTIVFTNGCFDLLHPGHVRYLTEARSLGDVLVVALNSDRAVRELKGPSRPILYENERAEVMAALACVDYVTIFDDVSPLQTIVTLRPDVLVKGGDWQPDQIIGRDQVEGCGGKVLSLPFLEGVSTSEIIQRIFEAGPKAQP